MTDRSHHLKLALIVFFGALISIFCLVLTRPDADPEEDGKKGGREGKSIQGERGDAGGERFSFPDGETLPSPGTVTEVLDEGGYPSSGPEWEGQPFPQFLQVPRELEGSRVLACDEVLLDSGKTMRLSVLSGGGDADSLLFIEMGDGYGGVAKRGVFDPSLIRIEHDPSDNTVIFHRLSASGLGDTAMSSLRDGRISVQAPDNPLLLLEFLGAVQDWLKAEGRAQLVPARPEWGDIPPSHGDRMVLLR